MVGISWESGTSQVSKNQQSCTIYYSSSESDTRSTEKWCHEKCGVCFSKFVSVIHCKIPRPYDAKFFLKFSVIGWKRRVNQLFWNQPEHSTINIHLDISVWSCKSEEIKFKSTLFKVVLMFGLSFKSYNPSWNFHSERENNSAFFFRTNSYF